MAYPTFLKERDALLTFIIIIIHFISGTWPIKYRTHREEKKQQTNTNTETTDYR